MRDAEKGIKTRDKNLRSEAKDDEKLVKKIERKQTEQRIVQQKEADKAEKERQKDEATLAAARDDTGKLHQALLAVQKELVALQAASSDVDRQQQAAGERLAAIDAMRAAPGATQTIVRACTDRLAQLEATTEREALMPHDVFGDTGRVLDLKKPVTRDDFVAALRTRWKL